VGAVVVVVVGVVVQLTLQAAVADLQEAREGGAPAFFEDGAVQSFDVAVGLWAPGFDATVAGAQRGDLGGEVRCVELVAIVREQALEPPAGAA
jgi:hypothetical protein